MSGPLSGIRVIELAAIGPAAYCGMLLSDLGADVIRIDRAAARRKAETLLSGRVTGRGRRSIEVDLKTKAGVQLALDLVAKADALIEPFRPGVAERLGLGPAECLQRNKKLVYGRLTGWGQTGPLSQHAGHDLNYVALAGVLAHIGRAQQPPAIPLNLVADMGGGGMLAAFGIVCGLMHALRTGEGQVVDAAMIDGAASQMAVAFDFLAAGQMSPERGSNLVDSGTPFYDVYQCADGEYISIAAVEPQFYRELARLASLLGHELPPQNDVAHWPEMGARLSALFLTRSRDDWCQFLEANSELCFAPVLTMMEAPRHKHHHARRTFLDIDDVLQPAPAPRFSRTPASIPESAPLPGQQSEAILKEWLGADQSAIVEWGKVGALG